MLGYAARRGLLLIVIMAMAATAIAGTDEASFRRWGIGWGDASLPSDAALRILPGLRWRTPAGWQLTLSASFTTDDDESALTQTDDGEYSNDQSGELDEYDYRGRVVSLDCSRQFQLHPRLSLGPVLRAGHSYSRSERTESRLYVDSDPFDWTKYDDESIARGEVYWLGLGLRPQFWPHPRASVEAGLYLDYQHGQRRTIREGRREDSEGDIDKESSRQSWTDQGWRFNTLTPSVSMGLTLFFYF